MKSPWFRRLLTFVAMSVRRICGAANKLGELGSAGFFEHQPHQAGLLCFGLLVLLARAATGAPSDPAASFTPDLSGPQLQPRGEEAGEFSISEQTGSPSYRYSLTVPPGRRGIEPRVALVYSVGARDVAEGWTIDVPRIDRITGEGKLNFFDTGFAAHVGKFRDRLVRADNDVHTELGTIAYRAAVDRDFVRYEYFRGQGEFDQGRWEARTTDGSVYVFGTYLGDGWGLTQMRDRFGNRMDVQYESISVGEDSALYPADFWYTANAEAGLPPHAHLHLSWEPVTGVPLRGIVGARISYRDGARILVGGALLRAAFTEVFDVPATSSTGADRPGVGATNPVAPNPSRSRLVRQWDLKYSTDGVLCGDRRDGGRHRYLCEIDEKARAMDGSVQASPPIRFSYGNSWRFISGNPLPWGRLPSGVFPTSGGTIDHIQLPGYPLEIQSGSLTSIPIDLDGDGRVDILTVSAFPGSCGLQSTRYVWYRNTGSGFDRGHDLIVPNDFPGADGQPVLPSDRQGALRCSLGAVRWYEPLPTPESGPINTGFGPAVEITRQWVDLDGDGLPDLVEGLPLDASNSADALCTRSGVYRWRFRRNRGMRFNSLTLDPPVDICAPIEAQEQGDSKLGLVQADMNGDHALDLVQVNFDPRTRTTQPWTVYLSTGDFQTRSSDGEITPWASGVNWNNSAGLSLDEDVTVNTEGVFGRNYVLEDVNGDGLPDLLYVPLNDSRVWALSNTGIGFEPASRAYQWDPAATKSFVEQEHCAPNCVNTRPPNILGGVKSYQQYLIDFDGDGLPDLLGPTLAGREFIFPGAFQSVSFPADIPIGLCFDPPGACLQQLRRLVVGTAYHSESEFLDWTGDGRPDILRVDDGGAVTLYTDEPSDDAPSLLKTIDNGRGQTITFHYAPSSDDSVVHRHTAGDPANPVYVSADPDWLAPRLPFAVWVVKSVDVAVAGSPTAITSYEYEDPVTLPDVGQKVGAQFRGFQFVWTTLPKTATDAGPPTIFSRYDYKLDPLGLRDYTARYEAVHISGTPEEPPVIIRPVQRTADLTTYGSAPLLGGGHSFIFASQLVHIECASVLSLPSVPCEQQIGHRTSTHSEFTPDNPAQHFYVLSRKQEDADGSPSRATQSESISTDEDGTYLVLPKSRARLELIPGAAGGPAQWTSLTREESLYDGSNDPAQFGNLYGGPPASPKGLQTAHRIYRNPLNGCGAVIDGTAYDPATGLAINIVRPSNMQINPGPDGCNLQIRPDPNSLPGTRTTYDAWRLYQAERTDELGHRILTSYDIGTGNLLNQRGPNRKQNLFETTVDVYDGLGRVLQETVSVDSPAGYSPVVRAAFRYVDAAPLSRVIERQRIEWNADRFVVTTRSYDGADRLVTQVIGADDPEPPFRGPLDVTHYSYDERGALQRMQMPDPQTDNGSLVAYQFSRDYRDRVIRLGNPDATAIDVFYGPWERTVRDEDGSTRREISDGFGHLSRVEEDDGQGQVAATRYQFDGADRLSAVIDAGDTNDAIGNPDDPRRLTRFKHDGQGNRVAIVRPVNRIWEYEYDLNGNLFHRTDPDGRKAEFLYDDLNRIRDKLPIQLLLGGDKAAELGIGSVHYDYDDPARANEIGRLAGVRFCTGRQKCGSEASPYAQVAYGYDAQGRVTSEAWSWNIGPTGPRQAAVTRSYNPLGQVSTVAYPNGVTLRNTLYDNGLLGRVTDDRGRLLVGYAYGLAHQIHQRTSDLPQTHTYSYDSRGRLKSDILDFKHAAVMQQDYSYTGNGDVAALKVSDRLQPGPGFTDWTYKFHYDGMHRLVQAATEALWSGAPYSASFGYFPSGNTASAKVDGPAEISPRDVLYAYGNGVTADPQAVTVLNQRNGGQPVLQAMYDASGNLRQRTLASGGDTIEFTYDLDDLPRRVQHDNQAERYFYDHAHRRFLAIADDGSWRFYLGDEYELDVSAGQETAYVSAPGAGEHVARIRVEAAGSGSGERTTALLHHDRRGDLVASIDDEGSVQAHFAYGAFGEPLWSSPSAGEWRQRFNGKEQDQLSGLSYYGYRYYDPLVLRWTSGDPLYRSMPDPQLREPQRLNLYEFTLNNPLHWIDVNGLDECEGETVTTCLNKVAREEGASSEEAAAVAGKYGGKIDVPITPEVVQGIVHAERETRQRGLEAEYARQIFPSNRLLNRLSPHLELHLDFPPAPPDLSRADPPDLSRVPELPPWFYDKLDRKEPTYSEFLDRHKTLKTMVRIFGQDWKNPSKPQGQPVPPFVPSLPQPYTWPLTWGPDPLVPAPVVGDLPKKD